MRRVLIGLPLVMLVLGLAGCSASPVGTFPDAPVVVISIDTLRADHLSTYGYQKGSTPHLDRLAGEAIVLDEAYSPCPLTLPAHASLLTGFLPPTHGVRDNIGFTLEPVHTGLATRFKTAGWRTGAAVSAYVMRRQTGLARGFDFFDDALSIETEVDMIGSIQRDGAETVEALARWVEGGQGKFFAFLHLYEPHTPYSPPERYRGRLSPYDGEIAYADELLGRFLDRLRAKNLYDTAIIAVVSDHGEGLNDHGEDEHGIFLYREAVHVPALIRLPGAARGGTRLSGSLSLVDVSATILDLAGQPGTNLDGTSFRSFLHGESMPSRRVYSETLYPRFHFGWQELYAATEGRFRYVKAPRPELYDLQNDPGERRNLGSSAAGAPLQAWIDGQVKSAGGAASPSDVPADVRERLQALGYIGTVNAAGSGDLPDPKDEIDSYGQLKRALALEQKGQHGEAAEALRSLLASRPRMLDGWEALGKTLVRLGRTEDAIQAFSKVIELQPQKMETHLALARIYAVAGKTNLARQHGEIAASGGGGEASQFLAELALSGGRLDRAAEFARRSLDADDQLYMSHYILGVVAHTAGRCDQALPSYRKAVETKRPHKRAIVRNLHARMADCLVMLGRPDEAASEFAAELEAIPASPEARIGLAMLYTSQGRDRDARTVLEGLITLQSQPDAEAYWSVVRTLRVLGDAEGATTWAARARTQFPADRRFR